MKDKIKKSPNSENGFTLIELIVIMAIISILTLLAVPKYIGHTRKANVATLQQDIRVLSDAAEAHHMAHEEWPTTEDVVDAVSVEDLLHSLNYEVTTEDIRLLDEEDVDEHVHSTKNDLDEFVLVINGKYLGRVFHSKGVAGNGETHFSSDSDVVGPLDKDKDVYTVTFKDRDKTLNTQKVIDRRPAKEPREPEREGYTFSGWDKEFNRVTSDLVVSAVWEAMPRTFTFDANGGELDKSNTITGLYDTKVGTLPVPTKISYSFSGWYTKKEDGVKLTPETKLLNDTTYYAQWSRKPVITKSIILPEGTSSIQSHKFKIQNIHELIGVSTKSGNIVIESKEMDTISIKASGKPFDRKVQTSGVYTPAHSKEVSGETSSNYSKGGYTGSLNSYVYSGSYTPSDTIHVSNQTSSYYNSSGYTGSLSSYLYSGSYSPSDTRTETTSRTSYNSNSNPSSVYYNSGGYSGTLSRNGSVNSYVYSGSASKSKYATGWDYSDRLSQKRWNGKSWDLLGATWHPSKPADPPKSIYVRDGDYSGYISHDGGRGEFFDERYYNEPKKPSTGYIFTYRRVKTNYNYSGYIYTPDTRKYAYTQNYSGRVTRPSSDTRVYRYRGNVTRPASDTRVYRYKGTVTKPASDTRAYDYYYQYKVDVDYREQ